MRVLYVGCNLFGQIIEREEISIETFQEFEFNCNVLTLGHSVLVVQNDDGVYLHGHGLQPRTTHKITKLEMPFSNKIRHITTCDTRIFFLDESGELYVLDFLDKDVEIRHKPHFILKSPEEQLKIIKFVSGIGINVALSDSGEIFNSHNQLTTVKENIKQICAGNEHCLILDISGNVFSFGTGKRGQLGHGTIANEEEPTLIKALAGLKITKIACGSWHSCALSADGDVYTWGWNSDGQLGLMDNPFDSEASRKGLPQKHVSVIATPTALLIDDDFDINIANVACGSRHTVLITDTNVVYGSGCNRFNQLGLEISKPYKTFTKVTQLGKDVHVKEIICGPAATVFVLQ